MGGEGQTLQRCRTPLRTVTTPKPPLALVKGSAGYQVTNRQRPSPGPQEKPRSCLSLSAEASGNRIRAGCDLPERPYSGAFQVAIPFRGSISCNGTPLRTSSWTVLLEGGFVRIMKAGIYTWRIKGVLRGLARCKATVEAVDKQVKTHIALAQEENRLSRSSSGFPDTPIIALERNGVLGQTDPGFIPFAMNRTNTYPIDTIPLRRVKWASKGE